MGIGEKKTPEAFVKSCEVFTFTENLRNEQLNQNQSNNQNETVKSKSVKPYQNQRNKEVVEKVRLSRADLKTIDKAFDISTNEEENAYISTLGLNIRKIDPSFDPRSYGFKNLTRLFENIDKYEVIKNEVGGLNHPLLRIR
ncbi:OST-HTH/LOTUS domain-containing protein, partial [Tenacibaculum piscium]